MSGSPASRRPGRGGRPRWQRVLGAALVLAAAVFLALYLHRNWTSLDRHAWELDPLLGAVSLLVLVAAFAWGALLWRVVARLMGGDPPRLAALTRVWFLSSLARYIPGKIWQLVGAAGMLDRERMSPALTAASLLVHMGFILAGGVLAALVWGPVDRLGEPWSGWLLPGAVVLALAVGIHPRLLSALLGRVGRWTGRSELGWRGRWAEGLLLVVGAFASWVLHGAAFWIFARSLTDLPLATLPAFVGANALAFVVGYLAVVVPAGLGVREALLTVLLAGVLAPGPAAVVAIGSRLWTVAGEIIGAAAYEGARRLGGAGR